MLDNGAGIDAEALRKKIRKVVRIAVNIFTVAGDAAAAVALKASVSVKPPAILGKIAKNLTRDPIKEIDEFDVSEEKMAVKFVAKTMEDVISRLDSQYSDTATLISVFNLKYKEVENLVKQVKERLGVLP